MDVVDAGSLEVGTHPRGGQRSGGGRHVQGGVRNEWFSDRAEESDVITEAEDNIDRLGTGGTVGDKQEQTVVGVISVGSTICLFLL